MFDANEALHRILAVTIHDAQRKGEDAAAAAKAAARAFRDGLAEFELAPGADKAISKTPVIGQPFEGGIYAGATKFDGKPAHLILLPGDAADVSWDSAMSWAKLQGGDLPTRAEQRLLFEHLKSEFKPRWYWSGEQHEGLPAGAWGQFFTGGSQVYTPKSITGHARAVRRLVIQ